MNSSYPSADPFDAALEAFRSPIVDTIRAGDLSNVWSLPGGELVLPRVFGFCRGVKRALVMADQAVADHAGHPGQLLLLGEIIHNPWVNDYFHRRGVTFLHRDQVQQIEQHVATQDCVIIPAFGIPLPIEQRLKTIGCKTIDCSCGDVIRLWRWSEQEARDGLGVMIFGRARHDETVVTKSRLAEAGGKYLVVEHLRQVEFFGQLISGESAESGFRRAFNEDATNADSIEPFLRLAQVSQTTMLYNHTQKVREILREAFTKRFGQEEANQRLRFQPTVCRATQDRQNAAVELCQAGCDLVIVVGGFASSNTRHLYELAGQFTTAFLIENAAAIRSDRELCAWDRNTDSETRVEDWLPSERPIRVGVLAGASSPEIVIGNVLERLAQFLR